MVRALSEAQGRALAAIVAAPEAVIDREDLEAEGVRGATLAVLEAAGLVVRWEVRGATMVTLTPRGERHLNVEIVEHWEHRAGGDVEVPRWRACPPPWEARRRRPVRMRPSRLGECGLALPELVVSSAPGPAELAELAEEVERFRQRAAAEVLAPPRMLMGVPVAEDRRLRSAGTARTAPPEPPTC